MAIDIVTFYYKIYEPDPELSLPPNGPDSNGEWGGLPDPVLWRMGGKASTL
jgi:hypothetical protein